MNINELKKGNWVKFKGELVKIIDIKDNKTVIIGNQFLIRTESLEPILIYDESWDIKSSLQIIEKDCDIVEFHKLQNQFIEFVDVELIKINGELVILNK